MMFSKKCTDCKCNGKVIKMLSEHSKQHTVEHWIVVGLLFGILALQVVDYVI